MICVLFLFFWFSSFIFWTRNKNNIHIKTLKIILIMNSNKSLYAYIDEKKRSTRVLSFFLFLCKCPVHSYALLHTHFPVCVFYEWVFLMRTLSNIFLYVCLCICFFFSQCIFICMQWYVVCIIYGMMQRYRFMYVAVQQWSTKLLFLFILFNILIIETK